MREEGHLVRAKTTRDPLCYKFIPSPKHWELHFFYNRFQDINKMMFKASLQTISTNNYANKGGQDYRGHSARIIFEDIWAKLNESINEARGNYMPTMWKKWN